MSDIISPMSDVVFPISDIIFGMFGKGVGCENCGNYMWSFLPPNHTVLQQILNWRNSGRMQYVTTKAQFIE